MGADTPRRRVALTVGLLLFAAVILATVWLLLNSGRAQRAAPPLESEHEPPDAEVAEQHEHEAEGRADSA